MSHIAKHDYKNESINSKEGEALAEPLYTDNDIFEEKCNLNLSQLQTTKKNVTFKMSEKVNCDLFGIELRKDSLRRHIKTNHQKEEPSCVCVLTSKTQSSWCPKAISIKAIHFMCKKKMRSGTDPCLSCESDFYMNYMSMCAKSGLKNELCRHLGQVVAANTSFPEPAVLLDENFGFLGTW